MTDCPSVAELADLMKAADAGVEQHVASCLRCRALMRLMDQRDLAEDEELTPRELPPALLPQREAPPELTVGEFCIAASNSDGGTLLVGVVLDWGDETPATVEIAPVSTETENASDWDYLLSAADGPLGYPAMVEVWNHGTLLREQIVERLGLLVVEGQHRLNAMHEALLAGEAAPVDVPRGVAIVSDADPRATFQEEEAVRAKPFWTPAARAFAEQDKHDTLTVGALLTRWLEQVGDEAVDYAKELGWQPQEILLIARDDFDPTTFASERLAEAFKRTDIAAEDLEDALWQTVQPSHFAVGAAIEQQGAYRRTAGRRDRERTFWTPRGGSVPLQPEERERRRKAYINDVLQYLEEKRES